MKKSAAFCWKVLYCVKNAIASFVVSRQSSLEAPLFFVTCEKRGKFASSNSPISDLITNYTIVVVIHFSGFFLFYLTDLLLDFVSESDSEVSGIKGENMLEEIHF